MAGQHVNLLTRSSHQMANGLAGERTRSIIDGLLQDPLSTPSKSYVRGVLATPVVQDVIAYYHTWDGHYVALDYKICSTLWEINVTALISTFGGPAPFAYDESVTRNSAAIDGNVLYFGPQCHALLIAVNRSTGKVIDTIQINPHPLAIITRVE